MKNKSTVIKEAAYGNWLDIFEGLAPSLKTACQKMPRHVPCPVNGGTNGFRLFKDANETGAGVSNNVGVGVISNGFNMLMWVNNWSFTEALREVSYYLNIEDWKEEQRLNPRTSIVSIKKPTITKQELDNQRLKLRKVWKESVPINDSQCLLAQKYLRSRSIFLTKDEYNQLSKTMRFHPSLEYWHEDELLGKFPAIITLVKYADGKPASLHRIYLDNKGKKLLLNIDDEILPSKKLMAKCEDKSLSGGAIQFSQPTSTLLDISEGIETGLAVQTVIHRPVWPCVSAALLANFNPPKGVKEINVWGDLDLSNAGALAAEKLKERMQEKGVKVNILLPNETIPDGEKGVDWNDVLVNQGKYHFPQIYTR